MFENRRSPIVSCLILLALSAGRTAQAGEAAPDFNRDIKPILSNRCYFCHGPDPSNRQGGGDGGFRLDTPEGATADLGGYRGIVAGHPETSAIIKRILSDDPDTMMPPPSVGKRLTDQEKQLLQDWIKAGAKYDLHWSYRPPVRHAPPAVSRGDWPRNEIDRFILARLEREKLSPSEPADRATLIRRVTLDLIGLPPTPEEVAAFVNDPDPNAYEKLVDRLLERPQFGEYWAGMWLDLARYADSAGYADDPPRDIWLYRDYVIRSLNDNKPFDEFTIEQIAGDLLPNPTPDQRIATAFHRNTLTNNEGGTNDEEFRNVAVVDRVNTTLAVWMGTTIACAQCHTHKYDPLSQTEYFRLFAILNNTADADRRDESPLFSQLTDSQLRQKQSLEGQIAAAEAKLAERTPELVAAQAEWEATFPRDFPWQALTPAAVRSKEGIAATTEADGSTFLPTSAATDTLTFDLPLPLEKLAALRLDALADDRLPSRGPGHGGGNFVITDIKAELVPADGHAPVARFVRVELPGSQRMLSLAEVEVFEGGENVARRGTATQSSTDFGGPAALAVDGNTNGQYEKAKSTTHTAVSDNPWWEVDLGQPRPVHRVVLWNRTDNNLQGRLANHRLVVLDERRQVLWQRDVADAPRPSATHTLGGPQPIAFRAAVSDYDQSGFPAAPLADPKAKKHAGWAIGGHQGRDHSLTLIPAEPVAVPAGSTLRVTVEQASPHPQHTLGRVRLSATADAAVETWVRTPESIRQVLTTETDKRSPEQRQELDRYYATISPLLQKTRDEIAAARKEMASIKPVTVPVMEELPADKRRVTKLQHRGNYLDQGDVVEPGTPAVFPPLPSDRPADRLALARWLVAPDNPLTARVIANRYWEQIFGIGIVSTSEEFGSQGELPVHPELLDWLATELHRLDWDMKAFTKLLVMSAAYQQSSRVTPEMNRRDPDNRLLARGPRFRMSAETVRDQALAMAGLLSPKMYGEPVKPPQPNLGLSAAFGGSTDWQTSTGEDRYRRAIYTSYRRSNPYPSMATFDAPNREVCTIRRGRTNTPLQALVTLNDPVYLEAAQGLARRVLREAPDTTFNARLTRAYLITLARRPTDVEIARLQELHDDALTDAAAHPAEATKLATTPLGPPPEGVTPDELSAWTVLANVLLNLDETLMRR